MKCLSGDEILGAPDRPSWRNVETARYFRAIAGG
jgi:hypothetical protein